MTKQLYEEALADVKKVKEVAEANAKRDLLEVVTPRIRDLIERELLREPGDDVEGGFVPPTVGFPPEAGEDVAPGMLPDAEGKVTLDIDDVCDTGVEPGAPVVAVAEVLPDEEEYEINLESVEALAPLLKATKVGAAKELELMVFRLGETIQKFGRAGRLVRESTGFHSQITKMISRVEDMYDYVQESVTEPAKKGSYETKLESYFRELTKLQEQTMSKKKMMNEEDVTLKLTGLPDDVDLDSVGVDLITGEDGGEGEGDEGLGGDEDGDDAGLDVGDLDLGGDDDSGEDEGNMGESRRLSDDTIVEIDEGMLRREISRMRKLREEAVPSVDGHGVGTKEFDDFGGGSDGGDPFDAEIVDLSPAKAARPLGEADEDLDEQDQLDEDDDQLDEQDDDLDEGQFGMDQGGYMDEADDLDQVGDERTRDDFGGSATSVPSADKSNPSQRNEALKRRMTFESRLQARAKSRAASLKKEAVRARARKDLRKEALLKKEYAQVAKRFTESVIRSKKITKRLAEAKALQSGQRHNGSLTRPADGVVVSLRKKLAETNLINAKLLFTNKLLQNESFTDRQKAQVIEQLDSAKTVREAKLVYESLAKTLGNASRSITENRTRRVMGSASRTTRPASTVALNEGYEAERWAKLAGIIK